MDLACDGGVLPGHFHGFARFNIDRAELGVRDIALIFQFAQIVSATLRQVLKPGIAPVIRGLLVDRCVRLIVENERHAGDALAVRGGDLMQ